MRATGNRPRITTKTFNAMEEGADSGLARDRVLRQVETSLERLGVERIDLYLTHEPDPDTPVEETYATFEALVDRGLDRRLGRLERRRGRPPRVARLGTPSLVQNSYSLLERGDEEEVIPLCAEHGIEYQAFSPLAGGWLTGKYRRGEEHPEGSRMTMRPEPYRHLESDAIFDGLEASSGGRRARRQSRRARAGVGARQRRLGGHGPRRPEHLGRCATRLSLDLSPADREEVGSLFR